MMRLRRYLGSRASVAVKTRRASWLCASAEPADRTEMEPLGGTSGAFHVKHEGLTSTAAEVGLTLTAEQLARLLSLEALLAERASDLGLVSEGDLPRIRERHVVDSFEAAAQVNQEDRLGVDLGSGGGLPGLVVAITRPELPMMLVESRRTRGAFLEL